MASQPTDLAACRAFSERHAQARMISATVNYPLEMRGPVPVLVYEAPPDDRRPPAMSRGPCPRCEIRGELGCSHQRPFVPDATVEFARWPARWNRRPIQGDGE